MLPIDRRIKYYAFLVWFLINLYPQDIQQQQKQILWQKKSVLILKICSYIDTKKFVCLSVQRFLSQFEPDWDSVWHKVAIWSRECSNTKLFLIGGFIN